MAWFINEVSFTGQYANYRLFIEHLKALLKLRQSNRIIRDGLYCSKYLPNLKVSSDYTVRDAVKAENDRDLTRQVLEWLDKKGPFIDSIREQIDNDDFELADVIVTEYAIGEAARQKIMGNYSALYSLETPKFDFSNSPLVVNQIDESLNVVTHQIDNFWILEDLVKSTEKQTVQPTSWKEMLDLIGQSFPYLSLSSELNDHLEPHPFSNVICQHVLFYMNILNSLVKSRNESGEYTDVTNEIINKYFVGDGAKITDESVQNKQKFKDDMTFKDPRDTEKKLFCSWHAKISLRYFRIHFEFPLKSTERTMAVCYIGPKLTKK
ncbi:hypothetical protein VCSRO12_2848 [Vibrio cholerae]|uniref:hypothetical protein n=1 Tax=Vibrio cholerae TaxID=666 RepID=UPI0011DBA6AB|nr:hypothetical protein [Vibrio cholerae]MDV2387064.1 hypothetical protein [Vibrio cholerae]TXZ91919.1 hypothetical protein FXE42_02930 [Vibrio cholerae]GHY67955.1 hypothetical protein VCSRO12_2848 [Vibrio cholerae]